MVAVVAACGVLAAAGAASAATTLKISAASGALKYNKKTLTAKAGKVTIVMTNPSPLQHDVAIKAAGAKKGKIVGKGGKSTAVATLKPGKYTFYCTVPGHAAAGMKGTLTVR
jgi:plastocyanin